MAYVAASMSIQTTSAGGRVAPATAQRKGGGEWGALLLPTVAGRMAWPSMG